MKLKPCPFCGSKNVLLEEYVSSCNIKCSDCDTEGPRSMIYANEHGKEKAIEAWNARLEDEIATGELTSNKSHCIRPRPL